MIYRKLKMRNCQVGLFFLIVTIIYFHKIFLGFVPLSADLMTGAYFPWLDYKWGYAVGVPVKNPVLSDVFDELYPWRVLGVNQIKSGQWPLWNPYTFSGTPLLANWQSAPIYPLNFLMILLGNINGWSALIFVQPLLSMFLMYLFLRELTLSKVSSCFGAISFAFAGFMTSYLEFATIGQSFMWLPLLLFCVERYIKSNKYLWLILIPLINFFVITAGSFQAAFFTNLMMIGYFLFRLLNQNKLLNKINLSRSWPFFGAVLLSITLSAIQLLPTMELQNLSIRSTDHNIVEYNFGLLPLKNILTFLAPDFFGNHSTANFWGVIGYQETTGYFGVIALVFLFVGIISLRRSNFLAGKFFLTTFLIGLLLVFDTPIGQLIFQLKIPILSTSYASRILLIVDFSAAVLAAYGLDMLNKKETVTRRLMLIFGGITAGLIVGLLVSVRMMSHLPSIISTLELTHFQVALKNMLNPAIFLGVLILGFWILKVRKLFVLLVLVLLTADMLKFGLKFTPFSKKILVYPETPIISYMKNNIGNFRMEREKTEVMPPQTWMFYGLQSPSGYDPLFSQQYADFYKVYSGNPPFGGTSRYAETDSYNSPFFDLAGVKYLVVAKRDKDNNIDAKSSQFSYKIPTGKYHQVFEDRTVVVLENNQVLPRVFTVDNFVATNSYLESLNLLYQGFDFRGQVVLRNPEIAQLGPKTAQDQTVITKYTPNQVTISSNLTNPQLLVLTDAIYPGWQARVDGNLTKIMEADGVFRAIVAPAGFHTVTFEYSPPSFNRGLQLSLGSLMSLLILSIYLNRRRILI